MGAPTSVEPKMAIAHSDMTRPRMCGAAASCIIVLPSEVRLMEKNPTNTIPTMASESVGIMAVMPIESPKKNAEPTNSCGAVFRRLAAKSPPATEPAPIAESSAA